MWIWSQVVLILLLFGIGFASDCAGDVLFSEGFESFIPGLVWSVGDSNAVGTTAYWFSESAGFGGETPHGGTHMGYCAGFGYSGTSFAPSYQNSMDAYLRTPLYLTNFDQATLTFWSKVPSLDSTNDFCRVLIGTNIVWVSSAIDPNWSLQSIDLTPFIGTTNNLVFEFITDTNGVAEGWYLDDVLVVVTNFPPANDNFTNATVISGASGSLTNKNLKATAEPGEPANFGRTIWYSWTAPTNGFAVFDTYGSGISTVLDVYTGSALNNLVSVAHNQNWNGTAQSEVRFSVSAGGTYYVRVDGASGAQGNIKLDWLMQSSAPTNDAFSSATVTSSQGFLYGNNCLATAEAGEPASQGRTVWWKWTAPGDGCILLQTAGSTFDTILSVFQGTSIGGLALLVQNDDWANQSSSQVRFSALEGQIYYFRVDGAGGAQGNILINVIYDVSPPPNDNFANATVLGASGTAFGDNCNATTEPGEPGAGVNSVWYSWIAATNGAARFSTVGSTLDTILEVYRGAALTNLVLVGRNDDWAGTLQSELAFEVGAGTNYYIRVSSYDEFGLGEGSIRLEWQPIIGSPTNDNVTAATSISGMSGNIYGNNCNATFEPGEFYSPATNSVWYMWVAPTNGFFTFQSDWSGAYLDVFYQYANPLVASNVSEIARSPLLSGNPSVKFVASPGFTYFIRMSGNAAGKASNFALNWSYNTATPPNDLFAAAIGISDSAGNIVGTTVNATAEAGEPDNSGYTVWYDWTATASGFMNFGILPTDGSQTLQIFKGNALANLVPVGASPKGQVWDSADISVVAGTKYYIRVQSANFVIAEDFNLQWKPLTNAPANDNFANAKLISGSGGIDPGAGFTDTALATSEPGEPQNAGRTIWWRWTAPANACMVFNTYRASFDTVLDVYTGNAVNALTSVAHNDDWQGYFWKTDSEVRFLAQAGTNYYIRVEGYQGAMGTPSLHWSTDNSQPGNDNFAGASFISGNSLGGEAFTDNCNATAEAGEPAGYGHSIWWTWSAPGGCSNSTSFALSTSGSGIACTIEVYRGNTLSNLVAVTGGVANVSFTPSPGVRYNFRVDGLSGVQGDVHFTWAVIATGPPPTNDNFAAATVVSGNSGTVYGGNCAATSEAGEPDGAAKTVWWSWIAPSSGLATFDTGGSTFDTILCAYTGTNIAALTSIDCNDDATGLGVQSRVSFTAAEGTKYYLRVDGYSGATGLAELNWTSVSVQPQLTISLISSNQASIAWQPDVPGWLLQETLTLGSAWSNSPSGSNNPALVPLNAPGKFYRVFKP